MTNAVAHLRGLAERSAAAYLAETEPQAILLVGSGATGDADAYSDIDLLLYYDDLPTEPAIEAARRRLGAQHARFRGRDETGFGERYYVDGVQHQLAHQRRPREPRPGA